jgi:hypothetical protein
MLYTGLLEQEQRDRNTWNTVQDQNWSTFFSTMNKKQIEQRINQIEHEQNKWTTTMNNEHK